MSKNTPNTHADELTTQSVFGLKFTETTTYSLTAEKNYGYNELVTVNPMLFFTRLQKTLDGLIDEEFNWNNVLFAGGLISGLLEKKYDPKWYETSDIDLFIYGLSKTESIKKFQEIYDYFKNRFGNGFYGFIYAGAPILNLIFPERRPIQVIITQKQNPLNVLTDFDLTHCQVGFDGDKIVSTKEFIESISTKTTRITKGAVHAYRLVKAYQRGYSVYKPKYCNIKNYFHQYIMDGNHPVNTDKHWHIENLQNELDELLQNETVLKNLNKNFIPKKTDDWDMTMRKIVTDYAGNKVQVILCDNHNEPLSDLKPYINFTRSLF